MTTNHRMNIQIFPIKLKLEFGTAFRRQRPAELALEPFDQTEFGAATFDRSSLLVVQSLP